MIKIDDHIKIYYEKMCSYDNKEHMGGWVNFFQEEPRKSYARKSCRKCGLYSGESTEWENIDDKN